MDQENTYRDSLSTIDKAGKRVWIYPKKPGGRFFNYRKILGYSLLAFLFIAPHLKINGKQMLQFDLIERKFHIFGNTFWPQDLWIFALVLVLLVIFVVLFTIVFGRLFCGWVCPQTIFMELVFRRIEYFIEGDWTHQKKLNAGPWNSEKIFKKTAKHILFWGVSFLIANTFLAYIIGSKELWKIQTSPLNEHLGGFISIIIFTTVFYGVFAFLREQVCTTICPYGRLQGVLLDPNSMVVAYDHKRGENRAKFKKNEDRGTAGLGDCIDCHQCVHVCPTGIDIRNGTQLECVNCTACIDACDHMMDSVGMERGLIGILSENNIINGDRKFRFTPRVKAYVALLILLFGGILTALLTRSDLGVSVFRQRGFTYKIQDDHLMNVFEINIINKSSEKRVLNLSLPEIKGSEVRLATKKLSIEPESKAKERFVVLIPTSEFNRGTLKTKLQLKDQNGSIYSEKIKLLGPII